MAQITHVVLRDGLPLVGWVEHRIPRSYGLAAFAWDEVRVGRDGRPELVEQDGPAEGAWRDDGWRDDGWRDDDHWRDGGGEGEGGGGGGGGEGGEGGGAGARDLEVVRGQTADERRWAELVDEVGGEAALRGLDTAPLPVEELDPTDLPEALVGVVTRVVALLDTGFERWPDPEMRTACHALLRLAVDAAPLRIGAHDAERTAAAVFWAVGRANHLIGPRHAMTNGAVLAHFGQMREAVVDHALQLLEPADHVRWGSTGYGRMGRGGTGLRLGRPGLLVSARRAVVVAARDGLLLRGHGGPGAAEDLREPPGWERSLRLLSGEESM